MTSADLEMSRIQTELERCETPEAKLKLIEDALAKPVGHQEVRQWLRRLYLDMTEPADA